MTAPSHLIDSNHISFIVNGRGRVREHFAQHAVEELGIPVVVLAELEYSSLRHPQPERWDAAWRALIEGMEVVPFDAAAAVEHARMRHDLRHHPIGERDLMIATIAIAHGCTLVTDNTREFKRVKGLRVVNWLRRP